MECTKGHAGIFWDVGNAIYLGHVGGYMTEGKICKQYT